MVAWPELFRSLGVDLLRVGASWVAEFSRAKSLGGDSSCDSKVSGLEGELLGYRFLSDKLDSCEARRIHLENQLSSGCTSFALVGVAFGILLGFLVTTVFFILVGLRKPTIHKGKPVDLLVASKPAEFSVGSSSDGVSREALASARRRARALRG